MVRPPHNLSLPTGGDLTHREPIADERRTALVAGLGLLAMTIPAILVDMVSFKQILVPGDAAATFANVAASLSTFRAGVFGILFVLICDVVVAWALYVLFKAVSSRLSLLTAWFRLVYAALLGVALSSLVAIAVLVGDTGYPSAFGSGQLHAHVLALLDIYYEVWGLGFIIFGAHLLLLGRLALKSEFVPRYLGVLLTIAGLGYIAEYSVRAVFPSFGVPLSIAGWGELVFMFWLLWTGRPSTWRAAVSLAFAADELGCYAVCKMAGAFRPQHTARHP
jgi:hypothetical protein